MMTYLYLLIFGVLWTIVAWGIREPRVGGLAAAFLFSIPITLVGLLGIIKRAPSPLHDLGTQLADRKQYVIFVSIAVVWLLFGLIIGVRTLTGRELTDEWWESQAPWVRSVIGIGTLWCGAGGMGMLYLAIKAKK